MTDYAQTLREGLKARILEAGTLAESRVYAERLTRLHTRMSSEFPCVCVYVAEDSGERMTNASPFALSANLVAHVFATGVKTDSLTAEEVAANTRDELMEQVRKALFASSWASEFEAVRTFKTVRQAYEGELLVFDAALTIGVEFHHEDTADTELAIFRQVDLTADVAPADDVTDTYDEIALETEPAP